MSLDYSSHYATTISDLLNLKTKHISPQFHIIYDDWITTMYSTGDVPVDVEQWKQLFMPHCELIQLSPTEATNIELVNKWLDPDELLSHFQREQQAQCTTLHHHKPIGTTPPLPTQRTEPITPIQLTQEFDDDDIISTPSSEIDQQTSPSSLTHQQQWTSPTPIEQFNQTKKNHHLK